jgi:hypothetical protein
VVASTGFRSGTDVYLLIDPPIGPFSPPDQIQAWLGELASMQLEHAHDPQALECIASAERVARYYLQLAASNDPA